MNRYVECMSSLLGQDKLQITSLSIVFFCGLVLIILCPQLASPIEGRIVRFRAGRDMGTSFQEGL